MSGCLAVPEGAGFVSSVTGYVDCQAQLLGSGAWQALAAPGSTLTVVLTGFFTIFIALIGYNLFLGKSITVRSGTIAFVKIGAVFALATSWPVYRTLVYDLVVDGPGQLVSEVGPRAGVTGSDRTLLHRLDLTDRALAQLEIFGPGTPPPGSNTELPPGPFGGFDAFALGGSRILFLLTAIGSIAAVRIIAGLMLALGPFFIAFFMFESTRSFFEGWIRVLAGAGLAAIGASIALGLELALLEPWLSTVLARRMAGEATPTVATELFVITCLFTIIVVAALSSCARVARGFRLPQLPRIDQTAAEQRQVLWPSAPQRQIAAHHQAEIERTRAAAVAGVLVSMDRRELNQANLAHGTSDQVPRMSNARQSSAESARRSIPLGHSFSRRPGSRASATAARRDSAA
jgi:type IV secretion system protein VirB6